MPHLSIPILATLLVAATAAHAGTPEPLPRCGGFNALVAITRATDVARVVIKRVDAIQLEVEVGEQLLGTVPATISISHRDSCVAAAKVGDNVIVAVEHGRLVGSPFEDIVRSADVRAPLVTAFAQAHTAEDRAKTLATWAVRGGPNAELAARFLASASTEVLEAVTAGQLQAMRKAAIKRPERWLAVVLARFRIPLGDRQYDLAGLDPDTMARQIASIFDFEALTDTDALADLIAKEPDAAHRWAAFERCDRVRKVTLDAGFWTAATEQRAYRADFLSSMCRRGQRPPPPPSSTPPPPPPSPRPSPRSMKIPGPPLTPAPAVTQWLEL